MLSILGKSDKRQRLCNGVTRRDVLRIGALVRQRDVEESETIRNAAPLLHEATGHIAHLPTQIAGARRDACREMAGA